jgi:hypothetical protein
VLRCEVLTNGEVTPLEPIPLETEPTEQISFGSEKTTKLIVEIFSFFIIIHVVYRKRKNKK